MMSEVTEIKKNSQRAVARLVFVHGAGAGSDSNFMQSLGEQLADRGVQVYLFDFDYMKIARETGKRRPPDRAPKLDEAMTRFVAQAQSRNPNKLPVFLAGKSMGARAVCRCNVPDVAGKILLGYPYKPKGSKDKAVEIRTKELEESHGQHLWLQGSRDEFGGFEVCQQVLKSLNSNEQFDLQEIPDGNHDFKPRVSSGHSQEGNWQLAAEMAASFMCRSA